VTSFATHSDCHLPSIGHLNAAFEKFLLIFAVKVTVSAIYAGCERLSTVPPPSSDMLRQVLL